MTEVLQARGPHHRSTVFWASVVLTLAACSDRQVVESFPEEFAGVGLELRIEGELTHIVRPLPGGPSEQAGLRAGDTIKDINGQSIAGLGLGDVVMKLRGRPGTQVTLGIDRGGMSVIAVVRRNSMRRNKNNLYRITRNGE